MERYTPTSRPKQTPMWAPSRYFAVTFGVAFMLAMLSQPSEQSIGPAQLSGGAPSLRSVSTSKLQGRGALHLRGGSVAAENKSVCFQHIRGGKCF